MTFDVIVYRIGLVGLPAEGSGGDRIVFSFSKFQKDHVSVL